MECGTCDLGVHRISANVIAVPKHVGMTPWIVFYGLYCILFYLVCILLSAFLVRLMNENKYNHPSLRPTVTRLRSY
jgi:hypothetical protein